MTNWTHSHPRGFWSWWERQDHLKFPNLKRFIENIPKHPGIIKNSNAKVSHVLSEIASKDGIFAVQNMRIREWVATIILQAEINKKLPEWANPFRVFQTNINDDVWHHLDAYIVERWTNGGIDYYWVDFTFSADKVQSKLQSLEFLHPEIHLKKHTTLRPPTMVTLMQWKMVTEIANALEKTIPADLNSRQTPQMRALIFAVQALTSQYTSKSGDRQHINNFVPQKFQPLERLREIIS